MSRPPDPAAPAMEAYGGLLHGALPGGAMTAVIADPTWPEGLDAVERELAHLLEGLPRAGVPRGRVEILLAATADGRVAERALERRLRSRLRVPVWAHDPLRSPCFTVGRTRAGRAVEVHDELREAEAVVVVGRLAPGGSPADLDVLVVPGLASQRTRAALASAERREAAALVPVQLAIGLEPLTGGRWRVSAMRAGGTERFEGVRP